MNSFPGTQPAGWYTLTALADLQPETKDGPRLRSILFIATDGNENHTWKTPNTGTFVADFSLLVDAGTAHTIFQKLCRGETVTFPGLFELKMLKDHLGA